MTNINIQDKDAVANNWELADNMSTRARPLYTDGHIFDEEQSVRWNREEVKRRNEEIRQDNLTLKDKKKAAKIEADGMIVEYLFYYADEEINKEVLRKLFQYVWGDNQNETITYTIQECEDYIDIFLERRYY